jgi:hypothetical protein
MWVDRMDRIGAASSRTSRIVLRNIRSTALGGKRQKRASGGPNGPDGRMIELLGKRI